MTRAVSILAESLRAVGNGKCLDSDIALLRLGDGQVFHGEGIPEITKALSEFRGAPGNALTKAAAGLN